jgi:hypothetical protein
MCTQATQLNSFSMSLPAGVVKSTSNSSGAQGPSPGEFGPPPGETGSKTFVVVLGISNGVLVLCLFLSWYTMIKSRPAKTFAV